MNLLEAFKEESSVSMEKLKGKGIVLVREGLEDVAMEMIQLIKRSVIKSEGKLDDSFLLFEGKLTELADGIDGKKD